MRSKLFAGAGALMLVACTAAAAQPGAPPDASETAEQGARSGQRQTPRVELASSEGSEGAPTPRPAAISGNEAKGGQVSEVVVTGSRLRTGLETPTPVTAISAEQLTAAAPNILSEALNQLPVFKGSSRPSTSTQSQNRDNGAAFLNLRGLGKERTLVLLDGRRFVSSATGGVPDISLFPQALVKRVEVVTGGASAAYGSDAVAGAVNFILDTTFEGTRLSGTAGISTYGDGAIQNGALTRGSSFANGAGHFLASIEAYHQEGIEWDTGRDRLEAGWGIAPTGNASPARSVVAPYVTSISAGGLISGGPLSGMQFLAGGVLAPFNFGTNREGSRQLGGDGLFQPIDFAPDLKRFSGFSHVQYDLTDDLTAYGEISAAQSTTEYNVVYTTAGGTANDFTIFSDNAFLPAAVRTRLGLPTPTAPSANPTELFKLKRVNRDAGQVLGNTRGRTYMAVAGLDWKLSGWEFSTYYMHGENHLRVQARNNPQYRRRYAATDAVVSNGQIVCRSTLLGLDPGCIPLNVFGDGSPSPAAYAWINGTSERRLKTKEDVASLSARASPFRLPAGDVNIAVGLEYRSEKADQTTDAVTSSPPDFAGVRGGPASLQTGVPGGWSQNAGQPLRGQYDVKEGFLEADAPLLKDATLARSLSVNGAVRLINYSTAGNVTTWKAGLSYEPVEGLRLRATRSRDIRAGNMEELFNTGITSTSSGIRINGEVVAVSAFRSGNPNLTPEVADTVTAGVVFRPTFMPGFGASIDYYDIDIRDAIAQLGIQQTVDQCAAGAATVCANVGRDASGQYRILLPTLNVASVKTSGVDFEVDYNTVTENGRLNVRLLASYLHKLETTVPGSPPVDRAGDIALSGTPHWSGALQMGYDQGPFGVYVQERYIGGGKIDSTLTSAILEGNDLEGLFYTDITIKYRLDYGGSKVEFFTTVNNVFNQKPRIAPSFPIGNYRPTNASLYDTVGRYMTTGVRLRF